MNTSNSIENLKMNLTRKFTQTQDEYEALTSDRRDSEKFDFSNIKIESKRNYKIEIEDNHNTISEDGRQLKNSIPFISINEFTNEFFINQESIEFLSKLKGEIAVLSVAGLYRTGKSYLLNKIIFNEEYEKTKGEKIGFQVGPTISACTKGLWLYPECIKVQNEYGILNLIVIDTEGIGATDEDNFHDTKIFSLALLLSSYFIYNSVGSIDENAINNLSFISNLSKNIQLNNQTKPYMPSFLWVLRDFSLKLEDENGNTISTKEYLEKSLKINFQNSNKKIQNKNSVRENLKSYFPERDCVALVRPTINESGLQNIQEQVIREEFISQITSLREKIFSNIKPKEVKNNNINSKILIEITKFYIDEINKGGIPNLENAFINLSKYELKNSVEEAFSKFVSDCENLELPMPEIKLIEKINNLSCKNKSIILDKRDNNMFNLIDECLSKYEKDIDKHSKTILNENKKLSLEYTEQFIKNFTESKSIKFEEQGFNKFLDQIIEGNQTLSIEKLKNYFKEFINYNYDLLNSIVSTYPEYSCFKKMITDLIISTENKYFSILIPTTVKFFEKLLIKLETNNKNISEVVKNSELQRKNTSSNYEMTINQLKQEIESLNNIFKLKENEYCEQVEKLKIDLISTNTKNDKLVKEVQRLEEKYNSINEFYSSKIEVQNSETKDKLSSLEGENQLLKNKIFNLESENKNLSSKIKEGEDTPKYKNNSALLEKLESQIKHLNSKLTDTQEKNIELETQILQKDKRLFNEKTKYEELERELNSQISLLEGNLNELENEKKKLKENLDLDKEKIELNKNDCIKDLTDKYELKFQKANEKSNDLIDKIKILENEIVKLKQTLEFKEIDLMNFKDKLNEKERYSVKHVEDNFTLEKEIKNLNDLIKQERLIYENKTKDLEEELTTSQLYFNKTVNDYTIQIYNLKTENDDLKENFEKEVKYLKKENLDLKSKYASCSEELKSLIEEYKIKEKENSRILLEIQEKEQEKYKNLYQKAKEDITASIEKSKIELEEYKSKFDKERNLYKEELSKINDEYKNKIRQMKDQNEALIQDKETEINLLSKEYEDQLNQLEEEKNNELEEINNELIFANNNLESLKLLNTELNKTLDDFKSMHKETIECMINKNSNELKDLGLKYDELSKKNMILEKEKWILEEKVNSFKNEILSKQKEIENLDQEKTKVKCAFEEYKEIKFTEEIKLKEELNKLSNEQITLNALHNQELKFRSIKTEELEESLEKYKKEYSSFKVETKNQIEMEFKDKLEELFKENHSLEEKLISIKKSNLSLEANITSIKSSFEKEIAVLTEKYNYAQKTKQEIIKSTEIEINKNKLEIENLKDSLKQNSEIHIKKFEELNEHIKLKDSTIKDLQTQLENDKSLFENKISHMKSNSEMIKEQFNSQLIVYEKKITELKSDYMNEKENLSLGYKENMEKIVSMYKDQIKQLKEGNLAVNKEILSKNSILEIENKKQKNDMANLTSQIEVLKEELNLLKINQTSNNKDDLIRDLKTKYECDIDLLKTKLKDYNEKNVEQEKRILEYENNESLKHLHFEKLKSQHNQELIGLSQLLNGYKSKIGELEYLKEETKRLESKESRESLIKTKVKERMPKSRAASPRFFQLTSKKEFNDVFENKENWNNTNK